MKKPSPADKIAIVTGGARRIGQAVCECYSVEGLKVVVADLNYEGAEAVGKNLGSGSPAIRLDVTSQSSIGLN